MAKFTPSSISIPKVSIPKPAKPPKVPLVPAFNANRALGMTGEEHPRGVFRPIAKPAAPKSTSWTNH